MKALRYHRFGGTEVLQIDDIDTPVPGEGQVLVRVSGSGINPVDWKIREGLYQGKFPVDLPHIESQEFSGTIEKLGPGVEGFSVGDEIYGIERNGTCADYIVASIGNFSLKPPSLDLPDSGGVPLAGMTAWQALFDHGALENGQKVLIHAASGGVGTFAVQLAKWKGATVYGTASPDHHNLLRDIGADVLIDYNTQRFEDVAKDIDLVIDTLGGETADRSVACLRPGGTIVSLVGAEPAAAKEQGKRTATFSMTPKVEQLDQLAGLIQDVKVRPVIDAVVPLIRAVQAHEESRKGHVLGKLVVDVRR